jgi:hypothetical protein
VTPEPTDLIRGARRTLEDVVLPALADPFAIEQAKTVGRVLVHLEAVIDEAYPLEAGEAEDLRQFLGDPSGCEAPLEPYRELRDGNVERKARLSAIVRELTRAAPSAATEARRRELDALLGRQLARERRWTRPRRPSK